MPSVREPCVPQATQGCVFGLTFADSSHLASHTASILTLEPRQSARSAGTLVLSCGRMSGVRRPSAERPLVPAGCATSRTYPGVSRTASGMPSRVLRTQLFNTPMNLRENTVATKKTKAKTAEA